MAKGDYFGPDLRIDMTPLLQGTQELNKRLDNGVAGVFEYYDSRIEQYMKTNAPWTDRTGNARNGLRAQAGHKPFESHWVDLWHSMPYGIWLEVRFSGRYAIVIPSLVKFGPQIMGTLSKLFSRLGSSG
jgi:hypothetical protein